MGFNVEIVLTWTICLILTFFSLELLVSGPVKDLFSNDTILTQGQEETDNLNEPIPWPDTLICKMPRVKDQDKYEKFIASGFASQEEFDQKTNEIFYTEVQELLHAISIGTSFIEAEGYIGEIKLEEPYVKMVLLDYIYFGHCAIVSLEALKLFLVEKGSLQPGGKDNNFILSLILKGDETEDQKSFYVTKLVPPNETIIACSSLEPLIFVPSRTYAIRSLQFGIRKHLRNCNEDPTVKVSPCIIDYYNKHVGNNVNKTIQKYLDMANLIFAEGEIKVHSTTGCKKSCSTYDYNVQKFMSVGLSNQHDTLAQKARQLYGSNISIYVVNHIKQKYIPKSEEIMSYTFGAFISDSGGILGIFLGISFWSIYNDAIAPAISIALRHAKKLTKH